MLVDEFLFDEYKETGHAIIRLYRWSKPCISLGRNQKADEVLDLEACKEDGIDFIHRPTGGQAIYHLPEELSYCLVASLDDIGASVKVKDAYQKICSVLIDLYAQLGLEAHFSRELVENSKKQKQIKNNLCFASWEDDDIIIAGKKIGGNAQRRARNVVLQHGSIPLKFDFTMASKYIKDIPKDITSRTVALNELLNKKITVKQLESKFIEQIKRRFDILDFKFNDKQNECIDRRLHETRMAEKENIT